LTSQANRAGLRTLPLKAMECGKSQKGKVFQIQIFTV
jgi:hypothetical protein